MIFYTRARVCVCSVFTKVQVRKAHVYKENLYDKILYARARHARVCVWSVFTSVHVREAHVYKKENRFK